MYLVYVVFFLFMSSMKIKFCIKMNALKEKLSVYLRREGLNYSSFCKESSIAPAAIHNIMKSKNPNPTIETVLEIANIMNCSLNDLFDIDYPDSTTTKITNSTLLKSVCTSVCSSDEINGMKLKDFYQAVNHIYNYCVENNLKRADNNFTNWYIKNKKNINI